MKDPLGNANGATAAVAGVGTSKSDVGSGKVIHAIQSSSLTYVLQLVSRQHALDAHAFHTAAISQFPIVLIQILAVFFYFRITFSKLIFYIPAGWPNFFPASLNAGDLGL